MKTHRILHVLFGLGTLLAATSLRATDIVWTNSNSGSWSTAINWSPNLVPGSSDNAFITNSGTYTVTAPGNNVGNLIVGGDIGLITLNVSGSLNISGTGTVNSNSVFLLTGTLDGVGLLVINSSMSWSGGAMRGSGTTLIQTNASLSINSTPGLIAASRVIDNFGTINWSGTGDILNHGGSTLRIEPSGVFNVQNDQVWGVQVGGSSGITVTNAGIIRKSAGAGTSAWGSVSFYNSGNMDIQTGTWPVSGFNIFYSGTSFTGAGVVRLTSNQSSLNGNITSENLEMATGMDLSGNVTMSGTVRWTGGNVTASGSMDLTSGSQLLIQGNTDKSYSTYTLNNHGTVTWTGTGNILNTGAGTINNHTNGLFLVQNDQVLGVQIGGSPGITLNNNGSFIKTNSSAKTIFGTVGINNNGIFKTESGTIEFNVGGTSTGNFDAALNCEIVFLNGIQILNAGATLTGDGKIRLGSGSLTINGSVTAKNFALTGGSLQGGGTLTVLNNMFWNGGASGGAGGLTIITNGATLDIISTNGPSMSGRTIRNFGTTTWSGANNMLNTGGGTFINDTNGLFLVQNDQVWALQVGGSPTTGFTNAGVLRKTVGTGTTAWGSVSFYNSGNMDIQTGTWLVSVFNVFYSGTTFTGAGVVRLASNQSSLNGNITSQNLEMASGMDLSGNVTMTGIVRWTGGNVTASGSMDLTPGSQLLIQGNTDKSYSTYTLNNHGTVIWSGTGNINNTGSGTINNHTNGLFLVQNDQVLGVQVGGSPGITLNNSGIIRKTAGTGTSTLSSSGFYNSGNLDIQTGTWLVNRFNVFSSGTTFTGAGVVRLASNQSALNGNITSQNLEMASGMDLSGNVTMTGIVRWTGGNVTASGSMDLTPGSQLLIQGNTDKSYSTYTLNNHGTVIWSGTGNINNTGSGTINNHTNGLFLVQNDQTLGVQIGGSPGITFNNLGIFRKAGATNVSSLGNCPFNNSKTIDLQSGTFSIPAPFDPSANGILQFGVNGTNSGQSGRLNVSGQATLRGTLSLTVSNGYFPNDGDTFQLMSYPSRTGAFTVTNGLVQAAGLRFTVTVTSTNVIATASYPFGFNPPVFVQQPFSRTNAIGTLAVFAAKATNSLPLHYQWQFNGTDITDATNSFLLLNNVQLTNAGTYRVVATNDNGYLPSADAILTVVTNSPDTNPPVVIITLPKNKAELTNSSTTLSGTAHDDGKVQFVLFTLNGGPLQLAEGTNVWSSPLTIVPGTNTVTAQGIDAAGNISQPVPRSFFLQVPAVLTVLTNGLGTISPNLNGSNLFVGRSYSMVALPAQNWLLSNWVATVNGSSNIVTNVPAVRFLMQSNLTLWANFITNPFVKAAGLYNGLFFETGGVTHASAGYSTIKVTSKLTYSGKLFLDGDAVSVSGKFAIDGTATKSVLRVKNEKSTLTLSVALDFGNGQLNGTVQDGTNWTANLISDQWIWTTNLIPESYTNNYTMLLPGFTNSADGPTGFGHGEVTVDAKGKIKLSGALCDGHPIKQGTTLSYHGQWPLYVPLYAQLSEVVTNAKTLVVKTNKEYQGSLLGWLTFQANAPASTTNFAPLGLLSWIKTGWTNAIYSGGFTNPALDVISSRHIPPVAGSGVRVLNMTNAAITMTNGNLASSFTNHVFVKTNSSLAIILPKVNTLSIGLTAKSGLFKGAFIHPNNSAAPTKFSGAVLQDYNYGRGFFVGTNETGTVSFDAE